MMDIMQEQAIVRELAKRYAEHTRTPEMEQKRQRWYDHNELKPGRPLILCYPEGSWTEILPESQCKCQDPLFREYEYKLRQKLYTIETLKDDSAHDPCLYVTPIFDMGDFGVQEQYVYGENRGSYTWDPPIKDLDRDFEKLKKRQFFFNRAATQAKAERVKELLDGIVDVRLRPGLDIWTFGLTWQVIKFIGLEELFLIMYDNPDGLHRLMAYLRDDAMALLDYYEQNEGLLAVNNRDGYTGSGGQAFSRELGGKSGPATLMDVWGFAESQETIGVSPEMFGEFIFPYQLPLVSRLGLNCYGCCEPVHERMKYISQIPRLRRVSVSPWCDQDIMGEQLQGKAIFSRKPNPVQVCVGFDEAAIREDIRKTLHAAQGCTLEMIMKDTHTVENQPWRLNRWVEIAKEEAEIFQP